MTSARNARSRRTDRQEDANRKKRELERQVKQEEKKKRIATSRQKRKSIRS